MPLDPHAIVGLTGIPSRIENFDGASALKDTTSRPRPARRRLAAALGTGTVLSNALLQDRVEIRVQRGGNPHIRQDVQRWRTIDVIEGLRSRSQ